MDLVKSAWAKMQTNSQKIEDNVCVLNAGMDFKEVSNTAEEMQLNQNKASNSADICGLFGVPAGMMSGNVTDKGKQNFITDTLMPLLNTFETAFDSDLLLESEKGKRYFAFDTRELTRGDILQRYNAYAVGKKNGFITLEDIRRLEDLEPIDFPFIQLGLGDVLYNPETGDIYTPNIDMAVNLNQPTGKLPTFKKNEETEPGEPELRFNPYHDPVNGKFTTSDGGGSGAFLYSKGGKQSYVYDAGIYGNFDEEYQGWLDNKTKAVYNVVKQLKEPDYSKFENILQLETDIDNDLSTDVFPEKIGSVEVGEAMTHDQADSGAVNPNFKEGIRNKYSRNCQTCAPAYELRRRGYDVEAIGRTDKNACSVLAHDPGMIWNDPVTGKTVSIFDTKYFTPFNPGYGTKDATTAFFERSVKSDSRYELAYTNSGGKTKHVVTVSRNMSGIVEIYDPQTNKTHSVDDFYYNKVDHSTGADDMFLGRIDNLAVNPTMAEKVLKAKKVKKHK